MTLKYHRPGAGYFYSTIAESNNHLHASNSNPIFAP